jgi:two-component system chemotaxis response regulator CheY
MSATILIVDDSMVARMGMKNILKDCAAELVEANSGELALEKLNAGLKPNLVFLDLTMPGQGGVETLRAIRGRWPDLPVIIVTADIQAKTIEAVTGLGCTAVERKPAERGAILAHVQRYVGGGGQA